MARITLPVVVIYVLSLILVITVSYTSSAALLEERIYREGDSLSLQYANELDADLEVAMDAARTIGQMYEGLWASGLRDRTAFSEALKPVLVRNPLFTATWTIWEVDAFGDDPAASPPGLRTDAGRFVATWIRGPDGSLGRSQATDAEVAGAFYARPLAEKTDVVVEPYQFSYSGKKEDEIPMTSLAVPVWNGDRILGVAGIDVALDAIQKKVATYIPSEGAYAILVDNGAKRITHPNKELIGKPVGDDTPDLKDALRKAIAEGKPHNLTKKNLATGALSYLAYSPVRIGSDNTPWSIAVVLPMTTLLEPVRNLLWLLVLIGSIGAVVGIPLIALLARSISMPIRMAAGKAGEIAGGELRNDMSRKFMDRQDEIGDLAVSLQDMLAHLRQVISDVSTASGQVSSGSQQLSSTSQTISQGASEQASSVEEISSSMEEMTSNIKQNADNAQTTERIALKSAQIAEEGGKAVTETVNAMKLIASKITIIEEIARSTNMLALNASIEAARAGEYGKGFAVVASEVGKLAERSQKESGEISKLSIQSVQIAEQAGATILGMLPEIRRTAELVQEISAASNEQNTGAEQINSAIMQLDKVVQQNASASEESASMAEELASQAEHMQSTIGFFKFDGDAAV